MLAAVMPQCRANIRHSLHSLPPQHPSGTRLCVRPPVLHREAAIDQNMGDARGVALRFGDLEMAGDLLTVETAMSA